LTRRLVDVAQDVFTVEDTDGDDEGYAIYRSETEETMIDFSNRLAGRYAAETIPGHVNKNELITREIADSIDDDESIESVKIQQITLTVFHSEVTVLICRLVNWLAIISQLALSPLSQLVSRVLS